MSVATASPEVLNTAPAYLSVRFFGQFAISVGGRPVERWRAGKSRSVFQYLMMHRGRLMTRDQLRDALWPEAEWRASSSSLKVACCGARNALGAGKEPGGGAGRIRLLHRDGGYLLDVDDAWCDADEFQELVREGMQSHARGSTDRATRVLRDAMALYAGDFLAGQNDDWAAETREYYRSLAVCALDVLRSAAVQRGDADEVFALGRRTLGIDALHEPTYRDLISVAGLLGQQEQAVRWYRLCERQLKRLIGAEPSVDTRQALHRVLNGRGRQPARSPARLAEV